MLRRIIKKLVGRSSKPPSKSRPTPPERPVKDESMANIECGPQELRERLEAGEPVIIIDVREDYEIKAHGKIPTSAHYPLRELPVRWEELKDANEVVCYCAGGARSYNAAMLLRRNGIFNATSMEGGITAWKAIGAEVESIE
jgi:rhodanese-related sulfurtransferase